MLEFRVDPRSPAAPSRQIADAVLDAVAARRLVPGDRLPSVRVFASSALVNPNTVSKAWRELELQGVLEGRNGSGVFVTVGAHRIAVARRGAETLTAFGIAARAAIGAGHPRELLDRTLDDVDEARATSPARRSS